MGGRTEVRKSFMPVKEFDPVGLGLVTSYATGEQGVTTKDAFSLIRAGRKSVKIRLLDVYISSFTGVGRSTFLTEMYLGNSNRNSFTITDDGTINPNGSNLNANNINDTPSFELYSGTVATIDSGSSDYQPNVFVFEATTQGNNSSDRISQSSILNEGRYILIPPNTDALVNTTVETPVPGVTLDLINRLIIEEF